jgi:hypothetical protein
MPKKPGLSIAVLLGKGKHDDAKADEAMDSEGDSMESEDSPGLVEAMSELRSAIASEDDEAAAKAFKAAMDCC